MLVPEEGDRILDDVHQAEQAEQAEQSASSPDTPKWSAEQRAAVEAYRQQLHAEAQAKLLAGRRRRAMRDGQGSGPLPFGYTRATKAQQIGPNRDQIAERGDIIPEEAHVAIVRRIFRLRDAGRSDEEIAFELALAGVETSRHAVWTPAAVRQVLAHEELYRTGRRVWAGIEAAERWPILLPGDEHTGGTSR